MSADLLQVDCDITVRSEPVETIPAFEANQHANLWYWLDNWEGQRFLRVSHFVPEHRCFGSGPALVLRYEPGRQNTITVRVFADSVCYRLRYDGEWLAMAARLRGRIGVSRA